ncbi:methyl-accepting chemotaxis protein [Vitiosangium sp. GDMCC 1.1324]|uniref:methyl-accepting chemotaxis protein n=1 Tax=Vitiosangium sp. (strain GDMCC 1.1324) TaxID=2138576 RepID=UPI000D3616DC|nr:methyl-accepting chemotaxis protein [Vitiosangium sp. GDMCC 1.1324]PTL83973.1 methyl-accepting chemotaxis protein [Vitiosangium sp. GDMCC 1.1324]
MGLGPKFVTITAVVSVAIAILLTAVAAQRLRSNLMDSTMSEGKAIAIGFTAAAERASADGATSLQPLLDTFRDADGVGYLYVVDSANNVLAHTFAGEFPQPLLSANSLQPGELTNGQRVKVQEQVETTIDGKKVDVADVAAPLSGGMRGVLHVGMKHDNVGTQVGRLWLNMMLLGLLIVAAGVAGVVLLSRSIAGPLRELTSVAAHIVESGDLTRPIQVSATGEVGQLARYFAQMVERLSAVTQNLQQAAEALNASTEQLNSSAAEQSQTVSRQASALQETQVTAQEIRQTSLLAAQKADSVLSVAERADELSRAGEAALEQTLTGLNDIRTQVQEIAQKILELGERTQQIGSITQTVKDLADQSNMLALNAAIEAVRSGEHGKGFGVVAREIRALADQSIESTDRVRELLDDIGNSVALAVRITERGSQRMEAGLEQVRTYGKNLRELSGIIQDNASAVRQIAAAVGQQNVGINQITTAVSDLSKMMDETVARIGATGEAATTLQIIADQLSSAVKAYRVQ